MQKRCRQLYGCGPRGIVDLAAIVSSLFFRSVSDPRGIARKFIGIVHTHMCRCADDGSTRLVSSPRIKLVGRATLRVKVVQPAFYPHRTYVPSSQHPPRPRRIIILSRRQTKHLHTSSCAVQVLAANIFRVATVKFFSASPFSLWPSLPSAHITRLPRKNYTSHQSVPPLLF